MTTTTRSPEETRAISRLRALSQGVKVYSLDKDRTYCVPSASGDGSAYQVQVSGETMLCPVPLGPTTNTASMWPQWRCTERARSCWRMPGPWS